MTIKRLDLYQTIDNNLTLARHIKNCIAVHLGDNAVKIATFTQIREILKDYDAVVNLGDGFHNYHISFNSEDGAVEYLLKFGE